MWNAHIWIEKSKLFVLNHYLKSNRNAKLEMTLRKNLSLEKLVVTNVVVEEKAVIENLLEMLENASTDLDITTTIPSMLET